MSDPDAGKVKSQTARNEEEVLQFWQENKIFEKSLQKDAPKGEFVFYEGPPTANAKPALHHLETRAFKDAIPRYKTMRGFRVRRKAGWDTHGLPVELQIEKELGFSGKPDIEKYGVEAFNKKCRDSVFRYIAEWEKFTDRLGYWVDKKNAYYTFDATYMESLWHIVKKISGDGRLYKDYKVVPWCSRCGTALSSHELAQGYKDVKDLSVTAMFELADEPMTYVLAWTTTPWTLPGNVGLAVHKDITYVTVLVQGQRFILAKDRLAVIAEPYTIEKEYTGIALAGKKYKPLYPYLSSRIDGEQKEKLDKAYTIYTADFVTTTDGTGVVHTAVMYGQDDFELGDRVGLPKFHLVKPDGRFIDGMDFLSGRFVRDEEVAVDIIKDLAHRGLLFSKEKYEHTYPFCWRCSTPLIYYARDSWYIRMTDLRDTLIAENEKINWEPAHIREGRFGEWLSGVKDWAISRERYWGTPLPVWESKDGTERVVLGSIAELAQRTKNNGNTFYTLRHGEAEHNISGVLSQHPDDPHHLTEKGKNDILRAADQLADARIDLVIASPFIRTRETAAIIAEKLGVKDDAIIFDERIGDIKTGSTLHTIKEYEDVFHVGPETFARAPEGGESLAVVRQRMGAFLYELEAKYQNKNILIVSHGDPLWMLHTAARGFTPAQAFAFATTDYPEKGSATRLNFVPLPHNSDYELDLHKPYIDQVTLLGDSGAELKRTPEVMDVWFDSGAMPFAQEHYPFDGESIPYPADFISEAIDQTRGWFYTLLAVGVLMGRGTPYKNVICLGHLLDATGAKMSKSKGNVIEPFGAMDEYGADLIRYWVYSVNAPGEGKSFDPKVLLEMKNKVFNPLINSVQFYEMYKGEEHHSNTSVLDQWMQARLDHATHTMTEALDRYDMYAATRELRDLVGDMSLWFVRRSRDRLKGDGEDAAHARAMLRHTLLTITKLSAPFTPFLAEVLYQKLRADADPISVHLTDWPEVKSTSLWRLFGLAKSADGILADMEEVRALVTQALDVRQKAGIKVRQPLSSLKVKSEKLLNKDDLLQIIADEVNVKKVLIDTAMTDVVMLDTTITDELKKEGELRDLIREVQDLRKTAGLNPKDMAVLKVPSERKAEFDAHREQLLKAAGLVGIEEGDSLGVQKS